MKKEQLDIKEIFLKDERYRTSYYFSLEKLKLSLQKTGLLHPPLIALRDGHLTLVSGWKRVLACAELSFSPIPVLITEEMDDLKTFIMAFYENLATREFSLLEKAEILTRLKRFGEDEKRIIRHDMPLLDIPATLHYLDTYLAFSRFEPEVKKAIHEKNMSFLSVKPLVEFSPRERKQLLPLLLALGQNKRKELLEDILEVSRKNDIPAQKILLSPEFQAIQESETLTPLQKADSIRLLLKKKRYPALSSMQDSFKSLLKKVDWPEEITISPSPFFEEEDFTVRFTFKSEEQLKAGLLKLEELSARKDFAKIFKLK
ncbi:MAG: ParB N-terminal domain-containing protein [Candidatus Aminicenantes bacterium]|nr:ParB N-terminal domain-containing protein [Candidatus Aminicenantes bacterium]